MPGEKAVYRVVRVADGRELTRYVSTASYSVCHEPAVSPTGDRVAINEGGGTWMILRKGEPAEQLFGPTIYSTGRSGPLLGTPDDLVVVHRDQAEVTGWRLHTSSGIGIFNAPTLLDGRRAIVVRAGKNGSRTADRLAVLAVDGQDRTLGSAAIPPVPSNSNYLLTVNRSQTLVADVSGTSKITVYSLPDLREVTAFTARPPQGLEDPLYMFFAADDELVTVSGTIVEHWSARDGRRLSAPFDLRSVFAGGPVLRDFQVLPHYKPGHVQVTNQADHTLRAVRLDTAKEDPGLRIRLGDDMITAKIERSGRYAMVLTSGRVIEIWSVADHRQIGRASWRERV